MPLNINDLGDAMAAAASSFNNVAIDTEDTAAMEAYRKAFWRSLAAEIINHIKAKASVSVPGSGLQAGPYSVTGTATGTIS